MVKRTLSQNFLIDPNTIEKLVNSTCVGSTENVLEIGPGKGAITKKLASRASQLIAVEKDRKHVDHVLVKHVKDEVTVSSVSFSSMGKHQVLQKFELAN